MTNLRHEQLINIETFFFIMKQERTYSNLQFEMPGKFENFCIIF